MRRAFRILALLVALGCVLFWTVLGAHRGWTMTSVPVRTLDEVTGIEGITYEEGLVPGVDFLGGGLLTAGLFLVVSSFFRPTGTRPLST